MYILKVIKHTFYEKKNILSTQQIGRKPLLERKGSTLFIEKRKYVYTGLPCLAALWCHLQQVFEKSTKGLPQQATCHPQKEMTSTLLQKMRKHTLTLSHQTLPNAVVNMES